MFFDQHAAVSVIFSTLVALATSTPSVAATPCSAPDLLDRRDQIRRTGGQIGETHCYRLDLATSGLLALDLVADGDHPSGAILRLTAMSPERSPAREPVTVGRTASERLVLAPAGAYRVEIRAEDPERPLPAYRLSSGFVELDASETNGEPEIEYELSETNGEPEIEYELAVASPPGDLHHSDLQDSDLQYSEANGEPEIELELGLTPDADDDATLDALLARLCRSTRTDDHADSLACATPIDRQVTAQLGDGWDTGWGTGWADHDTFRFVLRQWRTVEITTDGEVATAGTLYDRHGQRLASDDDGGRGDGFRLVRTLAPGAYWLRVSGDGGRYTLRLAHHDR